MASGGNYIPLFWALGIIFVLGTIIPLIVSSVLEIPIFIPSNKIIIQNETAQNISFSTSFLNQVEVINVNVNNYLTYFSYIPQIILIPLITMLSIALIYGIWKAIVPT